MREGSPSDDHHGPGPPLSEPKPQCGAVVSPWPPAVRLRVPNSPPSYGGSTGGSMSPPPAPAGMERPGVLLLRYF